MKSIQILFGIAAAVTLYIFLRFIVKRIWLFMTLRRFAKKHSYICKMPLSCLLPNNRNRQLVLIESEQSIYAIKLFGLLRKHCHIHFWSRKEYSIEWYFSRHGMDFQKTPHALLAGARRRSLGSADWPVSSEKEVIPLFLISPAHAPVKLTKTAKHGELLYAGEKIEDVLFADLDYLVRFIENRER